MQVSARIGPILVTCREGYQRSSVLQISCFGYVKKVPKIRKLGKV